jgi:multicomponent K+:H+ antiporter subunit E
MRKISAKISPAMVMVLTASWLVLNETLALAQIVLGAVLGLALAWASSTLRPLRAHVRRLDIAAILILVVLYDILRSNINVARIVLGLVRQRKVTSGFLHIPMELRDPHGLAALAAIVTATPGTVWVHLSADNATLTLHVLDLRDPDESIRFVKHRYETPLRRIFE